MGKVYAKKHHLALKRKRDQNKKIKKLLELYNSADPKMKEQIAAKIKALSPWYALPGTGR
jgi:hypothetical protein